MRLGLVEYQGGRTASFSVEVRGAKSRLWAKGPQGDITKQRRWLPEAEARAYDQFPDFAILRWGSDDGTSVRSAPRRPRWNVPRAAHVSEFINAQQEERPVQVREIPEPVQEIPPEYVMTKTGIVHKTDCTYAKRARNPIGFQTLEEAAVHENFQKYCKCILGE